MKNNVCDWDFQAKNPVDYELVIHLPGIENRMMRLVFDKVVKSLKSKAGLPRTESWPETVKEFDIPPEHMDKYRKLLLTTVQRQLIDIAKMIGKDGVNMVNQVVSKCSFIKLNEKSWKVIIIIQGQYFKNDKKMRR